MFLPACEREASPDLDFHFHGVYLPEIKELLPNYLNAWKYELLALQQLDLWLNPALISLQSIIIGSVGQ